MIFKKKANKVTIEDAQLSMTPEQLEKHGNKFSEACNKYKRVGIDTETTGLSWLTDRLLMISMATGPLNDPRKHRWVFPINSWGSTILYGDARNAVQKILDIPKCIFFLHNAKFDMHFLANIGVDWAGKEIHDTCVQGFMIDTSKAAKLKVRVREEFGEDMEEFKDKFKLGGIKKLTLEDHPLCEVAKYSALDPEKTLQLANKFYLPEKGERYIHSGFLNADDSEVSLLYDRIEAKMVPLLFRMERRGIKFDKRAAIKKSLEIGKEIQNLQKAIYGEAGAPFNINSWQQLKAVYKTKGHNLESTNETVLKELSEDGDKLAGLILKYRENKKIKSTYLDALCDQADKYDRIHTSFNLHIAETGRLSSSNPNLQNQPKESWMRSLFIAKKGHKLIVKDYSQIELRVLAIVSEDPVMLDEFKRGVDVHVVNAALMFNKKPELSNDPNDKVYVTKAERHAAKGGLSFGGVFGMAAPSLSAIIKLPVERAEYLLEFLFYKYKGVDAYQKRMQMSSLRTGYVKTFLGRRRYLPNLRSADRKQVSFALRQIKNTPIQGGAADIVKASMIHCDEDKVLKKYNCVMLLQCHDEIIFEVPEEHADAANKRTTELMEHVPIMKNMPIPFTVAGGVGNNWYEAKGE